MSKQIKKVKIDDHLKNAKAKNNVVEAPKKRGRPRKEIPSGSERVSLGEGATSPTIPSGLATSPGSNATTNQTNPTPQPVVQPQYDTTQEAKAVIQMPFEAASALLGKPYLKLDSSEIEAVLPSFKVVYDNRIAPYMGKNADLMAFGFVMATLLAKKYNLYKQDPATKMKAQQKEAVKEFAREAATHMPPSIPVAQVNQ